MGMSREEVNNTRYGEMIDLINCLSVYNGGAEVKKTKKKWSFEEVMALR